MSEPETSADYATFDITEKNHRKNVERVWSSMQRQAQLPRSSRHGGFYIVTRYDDVAKAARNTKDFSSAENGIAIPDMHAGARLLPVESDPPQQTEYRSLFMRFLSKEAIYKHEPMVKAVARNLWGSVMGRPEIDFAQDFARPYPAIVVLTLLGIADRDIDRLTYLVDTSIDGAEGEGRSGPQRIAAARELTDYLNGVLAAKREAPYDPDDVISTIAHSKLPTAPLGPKEQSSLLKIFIFGGFTTTTFAVTSAIRWLLDHPADLSRLLTRPELLQTAVDEFVRFASPGTYLGRTVMRDTTIGDTPLRRGDRILLAPGAANRDPNIFERPDEIVLERSPNRHLGFGHGPHGCMGTHLARLEIHIALQECLTRIGDYRIDTRREIRWASGETQGMTTLPLRLQASG